MFLCWILPFPFPPRSSKFCIHKISTTPIQVQQWSSQFKNCNSGFRELSQHPIPTPTLNFSACVIVWHLITFSLTRNYIHALSCFSFTASITAIIQQVSGQQRLLFTFHQRSTYSASTVFDSKQTFNKYPLNLTEWNKPPDSPSDLPCS